ncbi:MAG: hypothetical protein AABW64_04900 [Nanoarchaeota archaeon]
MSSLDRKMKREGWKKLTLVQNYTPFGDGIQSIEDTYIVESLRQADIPLCLETDPEVSGGWRSLYVPSEQFKRAMECTRPQRPFEYEPK